MWVNQRPSTQSLCTKGAYVRLDVSVSEADRSSAKGRSHEQQSENCTRKVTQKGT